MPDVPSLTRLRLVTVALLIAFAALACSDDPDSPTPTAPAATATAPAGATASPPPAMTAPTSPPATATTPPPACPMAPAVCTLAQSLKSALAARQIDNVVTATAVRTSTCPGGQPQGPGGPFPLCQGAPAGEQRTGVQIARRYSEGAIVSQADYRRILTQLLDAVDPAASDSFGPGALQLYAVSCADQNPAPGACQRFAVIFSGIFKQSAIPPLGLGTGRELVIFYSMAPAQGTSATPVTEMWTGIVMANETDAILNGGTLFDLGRVFPYR